MNIICLSSQNWDDSMWTNKQHIMHRLSKEHRVIYVDRGVMPLLSFIKKRVNEYDFKINWKYLFSLFEERNSNLTILTQKIQLSESTIIRLLKKYIKEHNLKDIILWVYQPEYEKYLGELGEKLVVYDCVDEYSAFPAFSNPKKKQQVIEMEKRLLQKTNLVFTSAPALYERKKQYNQNTYLVPNVADAKHFVRVMEEDLEIPEDIKNIKKPVIGFIGALDKYKVDFELLEDLARKYPHYSLVLIGPRQKGVDPSTRTSDLKRYPNVYFLGTKDYQCLPNYIKAFDVCIIPYNINEYTKHCFPIKFFEYLATGKPVVITALPALADYASAVKYAKNREEFIKFIDEAISRDKPEEAQKRVQIALENSWEKRINTMIRYIEEYGH